MSRYAAKLLFQFRFDNEAKNALRKIERRIVVFKADEASSAYVAIKIYAKNEEFCFVNDCGVNVFFEFVGIEDFMHLGEETDEHEVWYEIGKMKTPMERSEALIPSLDSLAAFKYENAMKTS